MNQSVLSLLDIDDTNFNDNNIIFNFNIIQTENYLSLYSHYQQETTKKYQKFLAKGLRDQFIKMNIKQKVRAKMQQLNFDILSNQTI